MKNFEKFEKEIKELGVEYIAVKKQNPNEICYCGDGSCDGCIFAAIIVDKITNTIDASCNEKKTKWLYEEYKDPLLTEEEKEYLKAVIKPFKDRIIGIHKEVYDYVEYIIISCVNDADSFSLPSFEKGTMYKDMKIGKDYSLKDLGLEEK